MAAAPIWHDYPDTTVLDAALAAAVASRLSEALAQRGTASIALSGGRTPAGFLRLLGQQALDWSRVHVTLADERWLPDTDPASNARLLHETLLTGSAAAAKFVSLYSGTASASTGQAQTEASLAALPWPLDVVVLGMGDDGHTASLFPQAPQLQHACTTSDRCAAITPVTAPYERLTLTLQTLASARNLFVHITSQSKRQLLENALLADAAPLPIRRVLDAFPNSAQVYWAP